MTAAAGLHVVVPDPWDAVSGGSAYDRHLVAALRAQGLAVRVSAVAGAWPDPSDEHRRALLEVLLASLPEGGQGGPDVVVDGLVAAAAPAEVEAAVRRGVRVHALVHLPLALEAGLTADRATELDRREGAALRAATSVLATSAWAAGELRSRHGLADVGVARPGAEPAPPAAGSWPVPQLLHLASVRPVKDQLGVVEALAAVADLPWTAVLAGPVGDAGYAAAVDRRVAEAGLGGRVRRTGPVLGDDLDRLWDATDLLLLPSRAETWGMVVTEALARAVPAVVSAGTGSVEALLGQRAPAAAPPEEVPDDVPGAVVPPGDPAQLARALRHLLGAGRDEARAAAARRRQELATTGGWAGTAAAVLDHLGTTSPTSTATSTAPGGSP